MSDDDLIRRGDVLRVLRRTWGSGCVCFPRTDSMQQCDGCRDYVERIRALPAAQLPESVQAAVALARQALVCEDVCDQSCPQYAKALARLREAYRG